MKRLLPYANLLIGALAIGLSIVAQLQIGVGRDWLAAAFFAVALFLALFAFRKAGSLDGWLPTDAVVATVKGRGWLWLGLLMPAAVSAYSIYRLDPLHPTNSFWLLHLTSLALFGVAVLLLQIASRGTSDDPPARPWTGNERFLVVMILLIGLFLRVYRLPEFPFGVWFDESSTAEMALRVLNEPDFRPVFVSAIYGPAHYVYLAAALFSGMGVSAFVLRLVSVIIGVLTIPAGFFAGKEFFGRRGGLVVAFLIAVAHWNVNFSRIGMFNISPPLFELLTIGFLLRGMRRGRVADYAAAGLSLGLGFNFYVAFQIFFGVIGLFIPIQLVARSGYLRTHWKGLLVLGLGALLLLAPIADYAWTDQETFFGRTRGLSIFAEIPQERLGEALLENTRKHLLMFNVAGDSNGRHGLPGEPELAPIVGALFVLGIGLSLARIRRAQALLLLLGLAIPLCGGIFSLTFEAPQASRTIPVQPAAMLLAALPIGLLWHEWSSSRIGRRFPRLFVWPLLTLLGFVLVFEFNLLFQRQINNFTVWNSYSTSETIAARVIAEEGMDADVYLTQFFYNHPTVRFLARNAPPVHPLDTTAHLPLHLAPSQDVILMVEADRQSIVDEARHFYPNAVIREYTPPFGGPNVLNYVRLSAQDIASIQGVHVVYFAGTDWEGEPAQTRHEGGIQAVWPATSPLPLPFVAEWSGVLAADVYDQYRLILRTPAAAEMYVDETLVASGTGGELSASLPLAKGNHRLRVRAVGGEGAVSLTWQVGQASETPIPVWALNTSPPVTNNGLLGRYYPNGDWQEPVAFAQIDAQINLYFHVIPLQRPYTVEWSGKIAIPAPGFYRFGVESIDESEVYIDEQLLAASVESNQYDENGVELTAGLHDIRIRFGDRTNHTHVNLYWVPPGRGQQLIPSRFLFPPMGSYDHIRVEDIALDEAVTPGNLPPVAGNGEPVAAGLGVQRPVTAQGVPVDLTQPRGLGISPDGATLYVADAKTVLVMDSSGKVQKRIQQGSVRFQEVSDLAVGPDGELFVLDAGNGRIAVLDASGEYLRDLPVNESYSGRSRGLFVDSANHVWIANTPNGQVASFDQSGTLLQSFPLAPGQETQPVDVAVTSDGTIYATDVVSSQLFQIKAGSSLRQAWNIPVANSGDGPHLAVGIDDTLYITAPEMGLILKLTPDGERQAWAVPWRTDVPPKLVGIAAGPDDQIWAIDSSASLLLSARGGN